MNSLEILEFLSQIPIPRVWSRSAAFVFNTQQNSLPGQHWVAIHVDRNGHGIFFDSYGMPPYIAHHIRHLRKNCKKFCWNNMPLQSETSKVCGQFCIMFLDFMSRGHRLENFLNIFSPDSKANDRIAKRYVDKLKNKLRRTRNLRGGGGGFVSNRQSSVNNGRGLYSYFRLQHCNCKTLIL